MRKIKITAKLKNFCVGFCLAGLASMGAVNNPQGQGTCSGMCAQCGTCGFGILALGLWLTEKRWRWISRIRLSLEHRFHPAPDSLRASKGRSY